MNLFKLFCILFERLSYDGGQQERFHRNMDALWYKFAGHFTQDTAWPGVSSLKVELKIKL